MDRVVFFFALDINTNGFLHIVAAGPIGRTAEAGASATIGSVAAIYSYSKSKGLFAGQFFFSFFFLINLFLSKERLTE